MTGSLPAFVAFVPLTAAAVLAAFSGKAKRWIVDLIGLAATGAAVGCSAALLRQTEAHRIVHWFSSWKPHGGVAIGVGFLADQFAAEACLLIAVLSLGAFLYSWRYLEAGEHHFHVLMLLFEGGMLGFALSADFFILFVFFELMGVAAYALTGLKIGESGPLQGAINFAVINSIGSFSLLLGIAIVYGVTGALNFAQVGRAIAPHGPTPVIVLAMTLVLVGVLVKAAIVPFHFWLDDAHAVAPTPVCILFSGIMVELGLYGAARMYWAVFRPAVGSAQHALGLVIVGAAVLTIVVGSLMCFAQQHLKRLLAFSTIAHSGIALVGIGLMSHEALAGSALYVAGHGLVKASLFVCAGVLLHRFASVHEEDLRGKGRSMPVVGVVFALGGLALAGLPPFGTETGKSLIEEAAHGYPWLPWVFGVAGALTGGAVLRAAARVFLGIGSHEPDRYGASNQAEHGKEERETSSAFDRTPAVLVIPAVVFLAAGLALGLVPRAHDRAQIAAARFEDSRAYAATMLDGHDAMGAPAPEPPTTTGIWYGLAAAAGAVALAGAALVRQRVSARVASTFRVLHEPIALLRKAHTGHVGDYVAWFAVGLASFGGLLVLALR
jgi:multicomponent Na+:H+ antiporter subunit D